MNLVWFVSIVAFIVSGNIMLLAGVNYWLLLTVSIYVIAQNSFFAINWFVNAFYFVFCIVEVRQCNYQFKVIVLFSSSNTFGIFINVSFFTCKYLSVVLMLKWPSRSFMYLISIPFSNKCVAKLCLKLCIPTALFILAFSFAAWNIFCALLMLYCSPGSNGFSNKYFFGTGRAFFR